MRNSYPTPIALVINQFTTVISTWARASGEERSAVKQEIALAVLACPASESVEAFVAQTVPKSLGIRKVHGVWRGYDACLNSCELLDYDVEIDVEEGPEDNFGIECTSEIARHFGVGKRRAQQLVRLQVERAHTCGDLFIGGMAV